MDLSQALQVVRLTDVGLRRDHNEDSVASDSEIGLLVLADGMGGYKAGEVASEIAVMTLAADLKTALYDFTPGKLDPDTRMQAESQLLREAVARANSTIYTLSQTQSQCAGMGTTLVVALFTNNRLLAGHIGDSRLYRFRQLELQQLTVDHSLLQELMDAGEISAEQARHSHKRNLVTRALGVDPEVELSLQEFEVEVDDLYLLCSDGLSDLVDDASIGQVLGNSEANLVAKATQLVRLANQQGGKDNISVILAHIAQPFAAKRSWYDKLLHRS